MAKEPTVDEAIERARRAQEDRVNAVRVLAEARQNLADVRAQAAERVAQVQRETAAEIAAAEKQDVREYNRAIGAGWTAEELRKIGFGEPEKKARTRRRSTTRASRRTDTGATSGAQTDQRASESTGGADGPAAP